VSEVFHSTLIKVLKTGFLLNTVTKTKQIAVTAVIFTHSPQLIITQHHHSFPHSILKIKILPLSHSSNELLTKVMKSTLSWLCGSEPRELLDMENSHFLLQVRGQICNYVMWSNTNSEQTFESADLKARHTDILGSVLLFVPNVF
jgi:hypothetical protein